MLRGNYEPNYEATLGLIRHLGNEDLKKLVNNDEAIANFVKNSERCKHLEAEKEFKITQNKSMAEYNLSLGPKLESGKSKLKELFESVDTVWNSIQEKQMQLKSSGGDLSSETALALLQTAAAESEEESEKIADQFYKKEIEIEEFLKEFQTVRMQMHLRRVKADKMKDLILRRHENNNVNGSYKLPSSVPYPVGAINMPFFPMAK